MSKELLFSVTADDCEWQSFCAGGKGGQAQQKTFNAIRCVHRPSGAEAVCRDERSQWQNKKSAFKRMSETKKFQTWLKMETSRRLLTSEQKRQIEDRALQWVEQQMAPENIKVETLEKGKWVPLVETQE